MKCRCGKWQAARAQSEQGAEPVEFQDYDAGMLNDWGGGNVSWWLDYLRAEIERANNHWREQTGPLPLYTHPQPAQPEGDWVKCSDKLPENSSPVQAITDDYPFLGLAVVPARYVDGVGWTDVDNTDIEGYEHPLCEVVAWKEFAQIPTDLKRPQPPKEGE